MKLVQSLLLTALTSAVLSFGATPATAQFDVFTFGAEISQGFQVDNDELPLVGGRSTFVRVQMRVLNPPVSPTPLDGYMRVFVDGVEDPRSPIFSTNGPFPAAQVTTLSDLDGTLNFRFVPPVSDDVRLEIVVNPEGPNFVPGEINTDNNTVVLDSLDFIERNIPELAYAPVDLQFNGVGIPDLDLIAPGLGDNFIQGIYPVSDWDYHRIDAPTKVWTQSVSGSGTALNNSLAADIVLMNPVPDLIYGWINGGLPYNGQALLGGVASMGNTQPFRYQRTFAHEVGHNFGLFHNGAFVNEFVVDVEHQLNETESLDQLKTPGQRDIMVAGLQTFQAWVFEGNYLFFFNDPIINPNAAVAAPTRGLFLNGIWNQSTGEIQVSHLFELPELSPLSGGSATPKLAVRTFSGGEERETLPISVMTLADSCSVPEDEDEHAHEDHDHAGTDSEGDTDPLVGFELRIPVGSDPIEKLVIAPINGAEATPLTLERSPNAPVLNIEGPAGEVSQQVTLRWKR